MIWLYISLPVQMFCISQSFFTFFFLLPLLHHVRRTEKLFYGMCVWCVYPLRALSAPDVQISFKPLVYHVLCSCTVVMPWYNVNTLKLCLVSLVHHLSFTRNSHSYSTGQKSLVFSFWKSLILSKTGFIWSKIQENSEIFRCESIVIYSCDHYSSLQCHMIFQKSL